MRHVPPHISHMSVWLSLPQSGSTGTGIVPVPGICKDLIHTMTHTWRMHTAYRSRVVPVPGWLRYRIFEKIKPWRLHVPGYIVAGRQNQSSMEKSGSRCYPCVLMCGANKLVIVFVSIASGVGVLSSSFEHELNEITSTISVIKLKFFIVFVLLI